jgi:hypothetical protein
MLFDATTGTPVTHISREAERDLNAVLARLAPDEIIAMETQISEWADAVGDEQTDFFASNWTTGKDWDEVADGVFQPLYTACDDNFQRAGWMFGWLLRRAMIRRGDDWVMYKNPEAGTTEVPRQFWGTFYWRRNRQP